MYCASRVLSRPPSIRPIRASRSIVVRAEVSKAERQIIELPVEFIRRPLQRTRKYDEAKVRGLADSIKEIGLQEPIDVLEVDGQYYGFSGCHRYEAHQLLGLPTIKCRVRKANKEILKMHMM